MNNSDPEGTVAATLNFVVAAAEQMLTADRIWLFGSRARQTSHRRSDIDIAIEAHLADRNRWGAFAAWVEEQAPTLLSIDLVDLHDCSPALRKQVHNEGVLLYAR